jgi:hypothetical protein
MRVYLNFMVLLKLNTECSGFSNISVVGLVKVHAPG